MEEKQIIEVEVFSQNLSLTRQNFIDFSQLVTKNHLGQIKVPFKNLDDRKIQVLNIFLYYIISIQKNFKVFHDDLYGDKYRSMCTKEVSDYYIRNKFVIEEYEFAFLCSKALSLKLQESAHIIYYLIYGRFASHPYINNLCGKKDSDFKHTTFKKGKQVIENLRLLKKRTINNEKTQMDHQLQNFKKELNTALHSQESHVIWKKDPSNYTKETKKSNKQQQQNLYVTERKSMSRASNLQTFIPQRISQGQNSSIFQTLPFQKKSYQTCTDWSRKGLMRKQKFNQFFDINDYKLKMKSKKSPSSYFEEKKENNCRSLFVPNNDSEQMSKINYENFKNISNNLKIKNTALDKIRTECSVRNHRPTFDKPNFESQANQAENTAKCQSTKESLIQSKNENQREEKGLKSQDEQQQGIDSEGLILSRNFSSIDGTYLKEMSFAKNFSEAPQRNYSFVVGDEETEKPGDYTINLLRSDDSGQEKENEEGKKLDYFSKTSVGFKKMNCKYKLQKYKSDYRKFMKTQLLDRIKQAS